MKVLVTEFWFMINSTDSIAKIIVIIWLSIQQLSLINWDKGIQRVLLDIVSPLYVQKYVKSYESILDLKD